MPVMLGAKDGCRPWRGLSRYMHKLGHRRSAARRFLLSVAEVGVILACGLALRAEPDPTLENRVEAAFLYNFAKFVDWPTNAFASADAPFVIAVLGDESMTKVLEQTVKGKSVGDRSIQARQITDVARVGPCQILFVTQSGMGQFAPALTTIGKANILVVGESPGFLEAGGAINFTNEEGRVRFEVNTAASRRAGLEINSKLLRLATKVIPPPQTDGK